MKKIKILLILGIFFLPFPSEACNIRPYAKLYVEKIHEVFGGEKPDIVFEEENENDVAGFYENGAIHIYKNDYQDICLNELPYLKSVIAHEYAHHASAKLRPFTKLRGESLAYVAEHAIGDAILGSDIEYDNNSDLENLNAYKAIRKSIFDKQVMRNLITASQQIYFNHAR